jgi:hypothetical protein
VPKGVSAVARPRFVGYRAKNGVLSNSVGTDAVPPRGGVAPARGGVSVLPEALESRTHLSVTRDAEGWTVVAPESDTRIIYVSKTDGKDSNNGRSIDHPVKSIRKGVSLVRNNSADQLLLKRGDVWTESFGGWGKSGRSEQAPILIGAYGEGARPRLNTGNVEAFNASGGKDDRVDNIVIQGLHLSAHTRLPGADFVSSSGQAGIRLLAPTDNFLLEDLYVEGYRDNIIFQAYYGDLTDVTVRRSVIVDAYGIGGVHAQGLYATGVKGLTLEENVFDHNGWNETVPRGGQTKFNHNVYLQADNEDVVVRGNVFANGSSHGLHARAGGLIENNLFVDNAIGMSFGLVNGAPAKPGGVEGAVRGNVFIGARKIGDNDRGWALEVGNIRPGSDTIVSDNIFAGGGEAAMNPAIFLGVGSDMLNESKTVGINDLTIAGNIVYDWSEGIRLAANLRPGSTGTSRLTGLVVRDNDFQNLDGRAVLHDMSFVSSAETWSGNRYESKPGFSIANRDVPLDRWRKEREKDAKATTVKYADPTRDAASYNAALGGEATSAAFVAAARLQSSKHWQPGYTGTAATAYVQAGFSEASAAPPVVQPPITPSPPPVAPPQQQPPPPPAAPTPPRATADVPAEVRLRVRSAALEVTVTYTDDAGIDTATLDAGDLLLVGPGGFEQPAELVAQRRDGTATVATYAVATPDGRWTRRDGGAYALVAVAEQVKDVQGLMLAPAELASFTVAVTNKAPKPLKPATPDRPPVVKKLTFDRRGTSITASFSGDVSGSIDRGDLVVLGADGTRIDPTQMAVSYDAAKNAATWTFSGLPDGALPAGAYQLSLTALGITDSTGRMLDGNGDGSPGTDYTSARRLKVT